MIVLEGPDRAGKSTLAEKLVPALDALGYPFVRQHFGLLPKSWDYCGDYLRNVRRGVIMDRFHMSELIYGNSVGGRQNRICPHAYELVDSKITHVGGIVVLLRVSDQTIEQRYNVGDKKEHFDLMTILRVNGQFDTLAAQRAFVDKSGQFFRPKLDLIVDTKNQSIDDIVESIADAYDRLQTRRESLNRRHH